MFSPALRVYIFHILEMQLPASPMLQCSAKKDTFNFAIFTFLKDLLEAFSKERKKWISFTFLRAIGSSADDDDELHRKAAGPPNEA
jgi:hypothetical protein